MRARYPENAQRVSPVREGTKRLERESWDNTRDGVEKKDGNSGPGSGHHARSVVLWGGGGGGGGPAGATDGWEEACWWVVTEYGRALTAWLMYLR